MAEQSSEGRPGLKQTVVRLAKWGLLDADAAIAGRLWFGALFGPVLIVAGARLIRTDADGGPVVLAGGIVITVVGLAYVVVTRVRAARHRALGGQSQR